MERKAPGAPREEHAGRTGSELKFELADSGKSGQRKRSILGAVDNCVAFPINVGADKKEAKESATKRPQRSLSGQENWRPTTENVAKNPAVSVCQESLNVSCLNDRNPKNKMLLKSVESRPGLNNATPLCGYREFPAVSGKTNREAEEQAANLVYDDISGSKTTEVSCSAVCGDGAPAKPSTPQTKLEFCDAKSKSVSTAESDSSNQNDVQDLLTPEETHAGDGLGKETSLLLEKSGKFLNEFDSIKSISSGAFGQVYEANEKLLNKYYAIKIVHYKENSKALREVKALADLHHRNIVRYYSCWIEASEYQLANAEDSCSTSQSSSNLSAKYLYIQMELCDTKTLRAWIDEKNYNDNQDLKKSLRDSKRRDDGLSVAQQLVSGVEYIHSKMLIHRDLKPANIMFGRDGEVKIGDFGLVTAENDDDAENLIERTVYKGTPSYMAPEQKSETTYDRKVDIFALGLIYLELLWEIPTDHQRSRVFDDARKQKLPNNFSHKFLAEHMIIKSMLKVKPEDRPEASQLKEELDQHFHTLKTQATERGSRTY